MTIRAAVPQTPATAAISDALLHHPSETDGMDSTATRSRCQIAGRRACLATTLSLATFVLLGSAQSEEYRLGPQDKIRIRVLEWLPARGTYQPWDALDGEYVISSEGTVSIPLVGAVSAVGKGADALARTIGDTVRERTGLQQSPVVSIEISQFRPFYVLGAVKTPGEYPWRPGIDVIKAIGVAGGRYRPLEDSPRLERDVITQAGVLRSIELEIVRVLARRARLAAEQGDTATIETPREVADDTAGETIMAEEQAIWTSRRESLARQLLAIDELKTLLQAEITSLEAKADVLARQLESARTELLNVTELANRGLSPANRQFAMDRVLGDLQSQQLDLSTAMVRARQAVANAERDKIALTEERRLQLAQDRQDTQAALDQLLARRHTSERLIYEASILAPANAEDLLAQREADAVMAITRVVDGRTVRLAASRDTPVLAGDVIEIISPAVPRRSTGGEEVAMHTPAQPAAVSADALEAAVPVSLPIISTPTSAPASRPGEG